MQVIVIGSARYDRARGELCRVDDGSPLPIRPQSLRVLDLLIDRAGTLVTRESLHAAVWPDVVVTDDSLVQCIAEIRRAIGDSRHEIVRTVPRRGYRIEAVSAASAASAAPAVELSAAAPPTPAAPAPRAGRPFLAGTLILAVALTVGLVGWREVGQLVGGSVTARDVVRPPLAVMAFRAERADGDMEALAAGWAEDLASNLARDADLRLVSTRSSFAVSRDATPVAAARQLRVRYLVDGTVHRTKDTLQVTTQLIDGEDGTIVWTERLNLAQDNLGAARDGLIRKLASSLQASMRWREKERGRQMPESMDAQVLTLRAYGNKHRYTPDAYRSARADFEEALKLAPGSAAAWAGLGTLNGIDAINHITGQWDLDRMPEALHQIDRAVALDPTLSMAFQGRAIVLGAMRRQAEALDAAEEAARIAPGDPDNLLVLAKAQAEAGRLSDALANMRRALTLYPIEPVYVNFMAAHVFWATDLQTEAIAQARRCVERAPRFTNCRITLASALVEAGRIDEARSEAREIRALAPTASSRAFTNLFDGVPALRQRRLTIADALGFAAAP